MSTRDERATEERAAELAAKAELAQMVAAACTSSGTPIDGKDAAKVVEHFAFFRGDLPDVPMQQLEVERKGKA